MTGIAGVDKLLATFSPKGLEDGAYTLEAALRAAGIEEQVSSIPFMVGR